MYERVFRLTTEYTLHNLNIKAMFTSFLYKPAEMAHWIILFSTQ